MVAEESVVVVKGKNKFKHKWVSYGYYYWFKTGCELIWFSILTINLRQPCVKGNFFKILQIIYQQEHQWNEEIARSVDLIDVEKKQLQLLGVVDRNYWRKEYGRRMEKGIERESVREGGIWRTKKKPELNNINH